MIPHNLWTQCSHSSAILIGNAGWKSRRFITTDLRCRAWCGNWKLSRKSMHFGLKSAQITVRGYVSASVSLCESSWKVDAGRRRGKRFFGGPCCEVRCTLTDSQHRRTGVLISDTNTRTGCRTALSRIVARNLNRYRHRARPLASAPVKPSESKRRSVRSQRRKRKRNDEHRH